MSKEIREIKQPDTWSCMACVAAMIAGEALRDVVDFVGHDGSARDIKTSDHPDGYRGFSDYDIAQYLLDRGYSYGGFSDPVTGPDDPDFGQILRDHLKKNVRHTLFTPWEFEDMTAILSVKSERLGEDIWHVILWYGDRIYDPNPEVNSEERTLVDYEIRAITQIRKYEWDEIRHWNYRHGKSAKPSPKWWAHGFYLDWLKKLKE